MLNDGAVSYGMYMEPVKSARGIWWVVRLRGNWTSDDVSIS